MKKNPKSEARRNLDKEWERLKFLVPQIINNREMVDDIDKNIVNLIDGQRNCDEIVKLQDVLSKDGVMLIIMKLEKDGIISCIELFERLRDVKFEKSEAEKEIEFTLLEKKKLLTRLSQKKEEIFNMKSQSHELRKAMACLNEKIEIINKNTEKLNINSKEAMDSTDRLAGLRMDMLKRDGNIKKTMSIVNEEVIYLKDEKCSAMRSIRELESKIDGVLQFKDSVMPKISAYRCVARESFKTLREAHARAQHALKGIE